MKAVKRIIPLIIAVFFVIPAFAQTEADYKERGYKKTHGVYFKDSCVSWEITDDDRYVQRIHMNDAFDIGRKEAFKSYCVVILYTKNLRYVESILLYGRHQPIDFDEVRKKSVPAPRRGGL